MEVGPIAAEHLMTMAENCRKLSFLKIKGYRVENCYQLKPSGKYFRHLSNLSLKFHNLCDGSHDQYGQQSNRHSPEIFSSVQALVTSGLLTFTWTCLTSSMISIFKTLCPEATLWISRVLVSLALKSYPYHLIRLTGFSTDWNIFTLSQFLSGRIWFCVARSKIWFCAALSKILFFAARIGGSIYHYM